MINKEDYINYWKDLLNISEWDIKTEEIDPKSVTYDNDCSVEDRYFVGIDVNHNHKKATIYHDRPLTDRDVIHELLHVHRPEDTEEQINESEEILYKLNKNKRWKN